MIDKTAHSRFYRNEALIRTGRESGNPIRFDSWDYLVDSGDQNRDGKAGCVFGEESRPAANEDA